MGLAPVTLPTPTEILALLPIATMKVELGITHSKHDTIIGEKIVEAYSWLDGPEGFNRRAFLTQTWRMTADAFCDTIELMAPPLQAVTGIRYRDADGAWQALPGTVYSHDATGLFGTVNRLHGQIWPTLWRNGGGVEITFTCGYGDATVVKAFVPGFIRALKILTAEYYLNRAASDTSEGAPQKKALFGIEAACRPFRIPNDH